MEISCSDKTTILNNDELADYVENIGSFVLKIVYYDNLTQFDN